jgi:predicted ester cyclase
MGKNLDIYNAHQKLELTNPPASIFEANEKYLSDDFQILDMEGNMQMNKEAYMGMGALLYASFPDFKSVVHDVREEGDTVKVRSNFEGTFTGDLDLSAMGMGVIPASGKKIVWPEVATEWRFTGDQIASIGAMDENGGLGPFLAAVGVTMPGA